jgi:hypothetical protein
MAQKIIGAQSDFGYGEVDVALKRSDAHPARKAGLRQCANMRILNSKALQNRPGRAAKFPALSSLRIEEVTMTPDDIFSLAFGINEVIIKDAAGAQVAVFHNQGNGAPLPWSSSTINQIVFAQFGLSIYITFGHSMRPQVLTWDGVSTWTIVDYQELFVSGQKRTAFYRISPQGITITPSAQTGAITVVASSPVFTAAWVGTRIRYINRQILITAYTNPTQVSGTVQETLPGSQGLGFAVDPHATFAVGDVVIGSVSGAKGIVTLVGPTDIQVQLLSNTTTTQTFGTSEGLETSTFAFLTTDVVAGPGGSLEASTVSVITVPQPVTFWDNEIMNDLRGYPASCFVDQFRLGFCDYPSVPNGIGWSAINAPNDQYVVGATVPSGAMFELAPDKVRVKYVVSGPESSEFVFCDHKVYYIKIDAQNPLKPGSVSFQTLSSDGAASVQPRAAQGFIFYVSAGGNSIMVVQAQGAYYRPFSSDNMTEFHGHLFGQIKALAIPNADGTFSERYVYALNSDGALVCGKYDADGGKMVVGWAPWSGSGALEWVSALNATVLFTTSYFGSVICEVLDDTQYLDAALSVNALPAAFAAPVGKGPLWWIPSQTVSLMDQVTRSMGIYQIDADGFIIPQGNGGEDLAAASLVAGQSWTSTIEPFCPNAAPGADAGQRMKKRQVTNFLAYVVHSTGFVMGGLFSGAVTRTSPALGTLMNSRRFPAWMQDDDPTLPPPERETAEGHPPPGSTYDPRVVFIKDTPGPLQLLELTVEVSI